MVDCVLSYHLNPTTCGTAKWNLRLARELGVPCLTLNKHPFAYPFVSVKPDEIDEEDICWSSDIVGWYRRYDLMFHARPNGMCVNDITRRAIRVYAANAVVARQIREQTGREDVVELWCPSSIEGDAHRGTINVLTFGMAHKLQARYYDTLKYLLDATGEDYTVSVSTAVHEGSPWDETAVIAEKLRAIFGSHLRVLGYLADDALAAEMARSNAVALFFDPAFRANNTTAWAALQAGKTLITNLDEDSPKSDAVDVRSLREWPTAPMPKRCVVPSWGALLAKLQEQPCAS